jgi:hypothetical protein
MGSVVFLCGSLASAQAKNPPAITFNSFTGIYHLSRDSRGLSLLTTEETILADFPGKGSFYGIKRAIPKNYHGRSVSVKILNVADAAGNPVPYKIATDSSGNLVITTGDPAITLYGSQTIKIRYQTSGVVNLNQKTNEFLLNVNGRGWDQNFSSVNATVYIPALFHASLESAPTCYLALNTATNSDCQINTKKSSSETVVTSQAKNLKPHQALVLKIDFRSSTFKNKQTSPLVKLVLLLLGIGCALAVMKFYKGKN